MLRVSGSFKLAGTGICVPDKIITNTDLEKTCPTTDAWVQENLGVRERHIIEDENILHLAGKAAAMALDDAKLSPSAIDLILVSTSTNPFMAPSLACLVQTGLGAENAVALDINAACSGFLYGLSLACNYQDKNILLIAADTYSKITDWSRRDCVFFGDGAGAAVLVPGYESSVWVDLYSSLLGYDKFYIPGSGPFVMDAPAVYEQATTFLPEAILRLLGDKHLVSGAIDVLVPHQPSIKVLRKVAEKIGVPFEKVITVMDRYANTASASIVIALDEARKTGRWGKTNLLAAVGAGWTGGVALWMS